MAVASRICLCCAAISLPPSRSSEAPASRLSAQRVFSTGHEHAGAAGLAPDTLVAGAWDRPVVIPGVELAIVDPQLAGEQVQLLYAGVGVRRILTARHEAHQHAHYVLFGVGREPLAGNARRDVFPGRR